MDDTEKLMHKLTSDASLSYQTAIQLLIYEGEMVWNRFNIFVVAHSIIIAVIGIMATSQSKYHFVALTLIIIGVFLCLFWLLLSNLGFRQCKHYYWSAIDIEERFFPSHIDIMRRTARFGYSDGNIYNIFGKEKPLKRRLFEKYISVLWCARLTIWAFIIIYVVIFIQLINDL